MTESESAVWDVIETCNGNRYIVLPSRKQAYIGNRYQNREQGEEFVAERPTNLCVLIGKVVLNQEGGG